MSDTHSYVSVCFWDPRGRSMGRVPTHLQLKQKHARDQTLMALTLLESYSRSGKSLKSQRYLLIKWMSWYDLCGLMKHLVDARRKLNWRIEQGIGLRRKSSSKKTELNLRFPFIAPATLFSWGSLNGLWVFLTRVGMSVGMSDLIIDLAMKLSWLRTVSFRERMVVMSHVITRPRHYRPSYYDMWLPYYDWPMLLWCIPIPCFLYALVVKDYYVRFLRYTGRLPPGNFGSTFFLIPRLQLLLPSCLYRLYYRLTLFLCPSLIYPHPHVYSHSYTCWYNLSFERP